MTLSLRARLLLTVTGLLAVVSVVAGLAIRAELHSYLINRVDGQLTVAGGRNDHAADNDGPLRGDGDGHGNPPMYLTVPGQADGTLGATITSSGAGSSVIAAGVLTTKNGATTPKDLSSEASSTLLGLPRNGKPATRNLAGLGSYRLVAMPRLDGTVLVTGLPLAGVNATISRLTVVGGLIAGGLILVAILIGGALIRLTLKPLRRVAATAVRVSELPLDSGEVVDAALTARQASETRVRQFVADASHELRTPLASIQGYAELCRRNNLDMSPDVAYALERVESESKRMAVLVDDLLLLARLDAGRTLGREDVDLTALLVAVVSDAHAAGDDHHWLLELPDEPLVVTGDSQRLHQVLANLLSNVRVHTPPGTTVSTTLALSADGRFAQVTVLDDGPGIPADLFPHVFERFARGDSSRSRAAGSSGLGLAIVSAVVGAHDGTIDATSEPGHTEFRLMLPLAETTGRTRSQQTASVAVPSS